MAASFVNVGSTFAIQPGWEVSTSPEGLTTIIVKYRGRTDSVSTFVTANPRGTACPISGYTSYLSVATPRLVHEGAFTTAYATYQADPTNTGGTADNDVSKTFSDEFTSGRIKYSGEQITVNYFAPTLTVSYIVGIKPTSFRFEDELGSDKPEIVNIESETFPDLDEILEGTDYRVETKSRWLERNNSGGMWRITEQHKNMVFSFVE